MKLYVHYITVKPLFQTMVFPGMMIIAIDSNPRTTRAHFTGSIPPEIGALVALTYLGLQYTNVEGASILYDRKNAYFKLWFCPGIVIVYL